MRRLRTVLAASTLVGPVLLILSGCGGGSLASSPGSGSFAIAASKPTIDTNMTDQLSATLGAGQAAPVTWSIVTGQNSGVIGQGTVDATGLYTPPQVLSQDTVQVQLKAVLQTDPTRIATVVVTVTPGFVQSISPENGSVGAGGTLRLTGQIAEVNAGSVQWSLSTAANGGTAPNTTTAATAGSIGQPSCHRSPGSFTFCRATYTAPSTLSGSSSIYLVAAANGNSYSTAATHVLLNTSGYTSSALQNQMPQTGSVEMGSSGGNGTDFDSLQSASGSSSVADCCGGTLGALVNDGSGNQYILSNNHVLAESDQAHAGDNVMQPGLVDLNCDPQAGRPVGALRYFVPIASSQTNVDAALAAVTPGAVDSSGAILQLGSVSNGALGPAAPAGGTGEALNASRLNQLQVVKSGRTTGLTCSTVNAVSLNVEVDYYYDCAETKPYYTKTFTNQIGMPGNSFTDSGDSGSLILDAANAEPVGLFFAGGSDGSNNGFSVANPIGDVLSELSQYGQSHGQQQFRVTGGAQHPISCLNYDANSATLPPTGDLAPALAASAKAAAESAASTLVRAESGILGLAPGASLDAPGEPAVVVYVDQSRHSVVVPQTIQGVRTIVIPTSLAELHAGAAPKSLSPAPGIRLSEPVLRAASAVQQQYAAQLMSDPAFFGVGVTESYDDPSQAALLVLADLRKKPRTMPQIVGGLRVRYMALNRLHVTRSKHADGAVPTSCSVPALPGADRVCRPEYGSSGCPGGTGPGTDYNKLKKWADRRGR